MSEQRKSRRAVEFRREITLILSEDNDGYIKEMAKVQDESIGTIVSRFVNMLLNEMRAKDE